MRFLTMSGILTSVDSDQAVTYFFELTDTFSYSMGSIGPVKENN